jgi:anti-anti-sigma factor
VNFSVKSREIDNATVRVAVFGDLDAGTDPMLQQVICDALAGGAVKGIIVDLDAAAVVDDAGIRAIENAHQVADRADVPLLVVNARSNKTRSTLDDIGILTATSKA